MGYDRIIIDWRSRFNQSYGIFSQFIVFHDAVIFAQTIQFELNSQSKITGIWDGGMDMWIDR